MIPIIEQKNGLIKYRNVIHFIVQLSRVLQLLLSQFRNGVLLHIDILFTFANKSIPRETAYVLIRQETSVIQRSHTIGSTVMYGILIL